MKLDFSQQVFEKWNSHFIKIHPVGVQLFHADGWTDMTKPIVAFRDFADAPKNVLRILTYAYKIRNPYNVKASFQTYSTLLAHTSLIRCQ
jgi:hypothetical protein